MGIPRLTQDLQAFLEPMVVSSHPLNERGVHLRKFVVDGPSMVYHVYNKLTTYKLATASTKSLCDLPSYDDLARGVEHFLKDLENCGADVLQIYFDGSLPQTKRSVRLQRLEKSRASLAAERIAHPSLSVGEYPCGRLDPKNIREALWQSDGRRSHLVSDLSPPFIVPTVIEHLAASSWSSRTLVVPNEAESYCAPTAKQEGAAILTNDSDLALFDDLQDNGVVVLLHSLKMTTNPNDLSCPIIEGRCWRPKLIREKIGIDRLLHIGFQRANDASVSFGVIQQRAKAAKNVCNEAVFCSFAKQFESGAKRLLQDYPSKVGRLDPRLSEVVCQFIANARERLDHSLSANIVHSTLPILFEDPTRDSSWTCGREFRGFAYNVLWKHYLNRAKSSPLLGSSKPFICSVLEYSRKGQRIAPETVSLQSPDRYISAVKTFMSYLQHSPFVYEQDQQRKCARNCTMQVQWILLAIRIVLDARKEQGKRSFTTQTILQMLGLSSFWISNDHTKANTDCENMWTILHLHANVQAVLYSLRMFKQAIDLVSNYAEEEEFAKVEPKVAELDTAALSTECAIHLSNAAHLLKTLPCMKCLFLTLPEMTHLFGQKCDEQIASILEPIIGEFKLRSSLLPDISAAQDRVKHIEEDGRAYRQAQNEGFVAATPKRKRKLFKEPNKGTSTAGKKAHGSQNSSNLFSILMETD